ncbi:hypothetical protein D3C81_1382080 [compost metagenome]
MNVVEIPVMNGRDVFDLTFSRKDGIEYLNADGRIYISESAVMPIYEGAASVVTIPTSGNSRWFKIDEGVGGRAMTVDLPQYGGYTVYDANGVQVNISVATGSRTTVLPESGLIVFGGRAGDVFTVSLEPK